MDEPARSTQPSLIMAPPGLKADPDGEADDAVVDNDIMSSSRARAGSSRSAAGERDRDADGPNGNVPSGDAATAAKDAPDATPVTVAPLPADTIGRASAVTAAKAKAAAADRTTEDGSPASPAETAVAETPAVKSSLTPSFTPSPPVSAPARVAPPAPAATTTSATTANPTAAKPAAAPSAPAVGYSAGNGSSPSAAAAVAGAAAGLANSVASAWQRRGSNRQPKQPSRPRGPQLRKPAKRQAMLTLARVEPWSVMKFSFVASVVAFIILFVAVAVLYMVLAALGVFDSLQHTVSTITGAQGTSGTDISHYYSASVVLGYTAMLGALNIVLITAMSTVGSVIYNLIAKTIGGIEVTLRETD